MIAQEWARVRPFIQAALSRSPGLEGIEDVERLIEGGTYHLWTAPNCAVVTEIADYGQKKALTIVHGGGDMQEMVNVLEPHLCDFARSMGCDLMLVTGRDGWRRVGENNGYRFGWLTMVKDLYT